MRNQRSRERCLKQQLVGELGLKLGSQPVVWFLRHFSKASWEQNKDCFYLPFHLPCAPSCFPLCSPSQKATTITLAQAGKPQSFCTSCFPSPAPRPPPPDFQAVLECYLLHLWNRPPIPRLLSTSTPSSLLQTAHWSLLIGVHTCFIFLSFQQPLRYFKTLYDYSCPCIICPLASHLLQDEAQPAFFTDVSL